MVDVALGSNQLILSVLQSGMSVNEVVSLEVMAAIGPHQLITQLPNARLQAGILLQKLSIALLDVLDDVVLDLHLIGALLQMEAQVSARHCDLLKQGRELMCWARRAVSAQPAWWVRNSGSPMVVTRSLHTALPLFRTRSKARAVALTELREGLVGSPLQSVVDVVTPSRGKPSRHGRVSGVSPNVHMDLAAPRSELTVRMATVCGKTCVAEAVQHVPKQGGKPGAVQPVTTEPSVGSKGDVGVVIHLSKIREKVDQGSTRGFRGPQEVLDYPTHPGGPGTP
jgi:hypothetical protein